MKFGYGPTFDVAQDLDMDFDSKEEAVDYALDIMVEYEWEDLHICFEDGTTLQYEYRIRQV